MTSDDRFLSLLFAHLTIVTQLLSIKSCNLQQHVPNCCHLLTRAKMDWWEMVFARNVTLYLIRINCYRFTIRIRHHIDLIHIIEHGLSLCRFKEKRHRSYKWIFELVMIDSLECSIVRRTLNDNGIMHALFTKKQWIGCELRWEFVKRNSPETRYVQKWKNNFLSYSRREWVTMTSAITSHCHQQSQTHRS